MSRRRVFGVLGAALIMCTNPDGLWEEPSGPQVWLCGQRAGSCSRVLKVASGGASRSSELSRAWSRPAPGLLQARSRLGLGGAAGKEESHRCVALLHTCSTTWYKMGERRNTAERLDPPRYYDNQLTLLHATAWSIFLIHVIKYEITP